MNKVFSFYNVVISFVILFLGNTLQSQTNISQKLSSIDKVKIETLMKMMTLEDKIGQLNLFSAGWDVTGPVISKNDVKLIKEGKVGAILNAYTVDYVRELQRMAVEDSPLKIPLLFGYDVIHGHRTIFPIPLGQACSWNLKLIEEAERVAAIEATAEGHRWWMLRVIRVGEGLWKDQGKTPGLDLKLQKPG
jgi:beta-glucosidase